jgi:hypothetical protein
MAIEEAVLDGGYNPIPEHCPPKLAALLKECWSLEPSKRPSASDIVTRLEEIQSDIARSKKEKQEHANAIKPISAEVRRHPLPPAVSPAAMDVQGLF